MTSLSCWTLDHSVSGRTWLMTQPSCPPVWWFSRCSEGPWALDPEHGNPRTVPSSRWKGPEVGTRSSSTRRHGATAEDWKRWVCWVGTCWVLILCWVSNNSCFVHNLRLVLHCGAVTPSWLITCWVQCLCRVRRARHICWVSQSWRVRWTRHTCRVVNLHWSGRQRDHCDGSLLSLLWCDQGQLDLMSRHVWQPRHHAVHTLTSVMKLGSGPGLRSADDLKWWRRWWVAELEDRTSVALPKARPDPWTSIGSACLALELDPPEDVGRVRFPLLRRLGEWQDLGESWSLSDPWPRMPQTPLRYLWCSDLLVPEGIGPPSDIDLPTTETLDETVRLLSLDLEGRLAESPYVALDIDEVALFRSLRRVLLPSDAPWVVTSLRFTMAISATMLMTVWTMVIWMKSLAGLLHMEYGKPVIRSLRHLGRGGCFRYSGCSLWSLTGRAKCWHQKTWMNPILQLECSLLGYPGQLAHHPLPAISTSWSVAFWPVGAGPSHHRHAGSHGLLRLTGPGRPDGRLLHFRSLRPRTCGCLGSLGLGRPVTRTLGRKLKDLFRSMYLNWAVHCQVLMVCWVDHTSRVVIIMCWLVTCRVDPSSFTESGTWAALPCWVVILLGPSHCEDDPSRVAEPCDQEYRTHRRSVMWFGHLALLTGSERLFTQVGIKDVLCQMWRGKKAHSSLRNSPLDRSPRLAKTASVQQSNCLCWSESPPINSSFWKFPFWFQSSKLFNNLDFYCSHM